MKTEKWYKIWRSWYDCKNRCLDTRAHDWKHYGGRGIKVCERWLDPSPIRENKTGKFTPQGLLNFYTDMEMTWFPRATIDRIDNDGDYTPENCRWVTKSENVGKRNKSQDMTGSNNPMYGRHHSISTKEKISRRSVERELRKRNQENMTDEVTDGKNKHTLPSQRDGN